MMTSRTGTRRRGGFTFIEVMVSTCVLALAGVFIFNAFFLSMKLFEYYRSTVTVIPFIDGKVEQAQEALSHTATLAGMEKSGRVTLGNAEFTYEVDSRQVDEVKDKGELFEIEVQMSRIRGGQQTRYARSAYAWYEKR